MKKNNKTHPRQSWTFDEYTNSEIRRADETGIYDIRGGMNAGIFYSEKFKRILSNLCFIKHHFVKRIL